MDDLRRIWPEMHARHAAAPLECDYCRHQRATCVGAFDDEPEPSPACDACCDHRLGSGRCEPLASDDDATGAK